MEIWKDIPGYDGLYQASSNGRIKSLKHDLILKTRGAQKQGYRALLYKDGGFKDVLVARMVALTFLGAPPLPDFTVNHKDGNRFNNRIENLEWLSRADNIRYGFENGQFSTQKAITLVAGDGEEVRYRSFGAASRSIGRNRGYISACLKAGRNIVSGSGCVLTIGR